MATAVAIAVAALLGMAGAAWWWQSTRGSRLLPRELAGRIPPGTGQLILVLPDGMDAVSDDDDWTYPIFERAKKMFPRAAISK